MDITYLGGSSFLLRGRDASLVINPSPGAEATQDAVPDVVTVSCLEDVPEAGAGDGDSAPGKTLTRPGEYEVSGILIRGLRPANPPANHKTVAYLITMDGVKLCHLGHLSQALSGAEVGELSAADVVFVPVSGQGTLAPGVASEVLASLSPRLVIPMWYPSALPGQQMQLGATPEQSADGGDIAPFLNEVGATQLEPQPRLTVTPTNMPVEREVVVLQPR